MVDVDILFREGRREQRKNIYRASEHAREKTGLPRSLTDLQDYALAIQPETLRRRLLLLRRRRRRRLSTKKSQGSFKLFLVVYTGTIFRRRLLSCPHNHSRVQELT